jgi:hypothetical protein
MNTNVVGDAVSDANNLTTEMVEVIEFRQNERNFQNRGNGISEIEGKVARVAMSGGREPSEFQTTDAADDTDVRLGSARRGDLVSKPGRRFASLAAAASPKPSFLFNHESRSGDE